MSTRPLRLGVLGCADVAARRLLPAAARTGAVRVTAIASRAPGGARELADRFGADPVDGYARLLARDDVDAVYAPVPTGLHAEVVTGCLRAGKHVLAEKPLTTSVAATREVVEDADRRGLVLVENLLFRRHRQHAELAARLRDGEIGLPRALRATFAVPRRPAGDVRHQRRLGGGALLDTGVYPIALARHLLGPGLRVAGASLQEDPDLDVETGGAALLTARDGVVAQLSFGLDHAYTSTCEVIGSRGTLRLEHAFTPPPDHRPRLEVVRDGRRSTVDLAPDDQWVNTLEGFARAVRDGARPPADPTLDVARLVDDVRRAATGPDPSPTEGT